MKEEGYISSYSVHKKYISIKVYLAGQVLPETIKELQGCKGKTKTFLLGNLQVIGEIATISLGTTSGFLVHTRKHGFIVRELFAVMNKGKVSIRVSDQKEDKILFFLDQAAKATGRTKPDILLEASSFKDIEGKRSVFFLSDEHKKVILDKLGRLIQKDGPGIEGNVAGG